MNDSPPTIFVVDDDDAVRDSLSDLIDSVGLAVATYPSAHEFLEVYDNARRGCLVLDIRMPGMSGLELQDRLNERGSTLPIVFITGHGDVPMAVEAMKRGAVDFIQKPFRDQELLDRINLALEQNRRRRATEETKQDIAERIATLTRREREVMDMVIQGKANKVIAIDLGLSQRTVEVHRSHVMDKMKARTLAELVRMNTTQER